MPSTTIIREEKYNYLGILAYKFKFKLNIDLIPMLDNLCPNQSEPLILLKRQYLKNSSCKMFFSCATVIYKRVR